MSLVKLVKADMGESKHLIERHIDTLVFPLESWVEDSLFKSELNLLKSGGKHIGYAAKNNNILEAFHVLKEHFRDAPAALAQVISDKKIERVRVMSHDYLLSAVLAEWEYDKEKGACFFVDAGNPNDLDKEPSSEGFRVAATGDLDAIRSVSGDFFEEPGGGFATLEERVTAETVFVIEDGQDLLGCGLFEKGRLCPGGASIGMFTNPEFRHRGVAKKMLLNLKKHVYRLGLIPVAGCWYYNTLSRRSLEAAGMVAVSIGYDAVLKGREEVPLQTILPPREN